MEDDDIDDGNDDDDEATAADPELLGLVLRLVLGLVLRSLSVGNCECAGTVDTAAVIALSPVNPTKLLLVELLLFL